MFVGVFEHALDAKGRVFIPAKWRAELTNSIVVTRGITENSSGNCLEIMSEKAFEQRYSRLEEFPLTDMEAALLRRMVYSGTTNCEPDKQGRALIPQKLSDYAGLSSNVTLVGVRDRIEVWDTDVWNKNELEYDTMDRKKLYASLKERGL